jgi:hypothetical protein
MYINKTKDYLIQLSNEHLISLAEDKFIRYQNKKLCVDHLIDLLDGYYTKMLRFMAFPEKGKSIPLNSRILLKKYGKYYNLYLDYLIENNYLIKTKGYVPNKNSNTYDLNLKYYDFSKIKEYKNYDSSLHKRLLRFYNDEINFLSHLKDYSYVLGKTIEYLKSVTIDSKKAIDILHNIYPDTKSQKFYRNQYCIKKIINNQIYLVQDKFGRIHTNYTVLKKEIRNSSLLIDNEPIYERDIKNSQPFFLLKLMADNTLYFKNIQEDLFSYYESVVSGNFYEEVNILKPHLARYEVKEWVMMIFFNKNYFHDKDFQRLFPTVYSFIRNFKKTNGYKIISHRLQNIESDFIFKGVCSKLIKRDIKYFTVHDSVCVKHSNREILDEVFDKKLQLYYEDVKIKLFQKLIYKNKTP